MSNAKKIWQKLLSGIVALVVVIVFFAMFMINNNKRVALQNGNYLSDAAENTALHIADELSAGVATIGTISELCRVEENNGYPEDLKRLSGSVFSRIDYISVEEGIADSGNTYYNGTLYAFSGESNTESEPDLVIHVTSNPEAGGNEQYIFYQTFALGVKAADGKAGICSEPQSLAGVQTDGLSFYVALRDDKGKLCGVLIGRYDGSKMRDILQTTFFGEYSAVYLIDNSGDWVATSDTSAESEKLNIYDVLRNYLQHSNVEELSQNLSKGKTLSFSFKSGSDKFDSCICRLPLQQGADGWIMLQVFPSTVVDQLHNLVNLEGLQLGLGLFFALVLYFGIILLMGVQNKKLAEANREMAYVVEGLANLYDRFVYVNLRENKYKYIANTLPPSGGLPAQGEYDTFKNYLISTFKDSYDVERLARKLEIGQIKTDMSEGTSQLRYEYRTDVDGEKWEDMSIICLSRTDGEVSEVLFARQNISELKKKELQNQVALKEAYRAAEDANRAKSDFLSSISHDIRTPMNAVLGFSELIEKSAHAPEKVTEYTEQIQAAGQHLLGLINDLLDMSKIESGKISLNVSEFNISSLIDGINAVISPQVKQKNQLYRMRREGVLGEIYLGDSLRIEQILINILSNAVKYTPTGGKIDFTVRSTANGVDSVHDLEFIISDNGIGMSEQFIKRLYKPFEREQNALTSKIQGTGLGMAITKNLVDLMGGNINVVSREGEGTTVKVSLRLVAAERADFVDNRQYSDTGVNLLEGMTFLVAEDNEINAEILCEFLSMAGAKYDLAENGEEAVKLFERNASRYDMILMDVQMPVMDGYEATRAIRSLGSHCAKTVPIVAMTANAFAEDIKCALSLGINAHVAKPVSLETLKATVTRLKTTRNKHLE